jgi:hypothetical protein
VSAGRASNIYVYFNGDWQTFLVSPVLDQTAGYQTFDITIGTEMRARMGSTINGIYFKAGSGFPTPSPATTAACTPVLPPSKLTLVWSV